MASTHAGQLQLPCRGDCLLLPFATPTHSPLRSLKDLLKYKWDHAPSLLRNLQCIYTYSSEPSSDSYSAQVPIDLFNLVSQPPFHVYTHQTHWASVFPSNMIMPSLFQPYSLCTDSFLCLKSSSLALARSGTSLFIRSKLTLLFLSNTFPHHSVRSHHLVTLPCFIFLHNHFYLRNCPSLCTCLSPRSRMSAPLEWGVCLAPVAPQCLSYFLMHSRCWVLSSGMNAWINNVGPQREM